ncbi:hypothetical protein ABT237_13590 [Streptomyces sp. NPDC001581]|uniref:hypothetical protein n=1 Tax=Streptomyces sp. NPDC001581 TaxID=3154386 RepID=UPI00332B7F08
MPTVLDDGWGLVEPDAHTREVPVSSSREVGGSEALTFPHMPVPLTETVRFGPGVSPLPPAPPAPSRRRRAGPGTLVPGAVAALAAFVVLYLAGRPPGEHTLAVEGITLTRSTAVLRCDETVRVRAAVRTNGEAGILRYRWHRSDGTSSGVLEERLVEGRRTALLETTWSISGPGTLTPEVRLEVSDPEPDTTAVSFSYSCPA